MIQIHQERGSFEFFQHSDIKNVIKYDFLYNLSRILPYIIYILLLETHQISLKHWNLVQFWISYPIRSSNLFYIPTKSVCEHRFDHCLVSSKFQYFLNTNKNTLFWQISICLQLQGSNLKKKLFPTFDLVFIKKILKF